MSAAARWLAAASLMLAAGPAHGLAITGHSVATDAANTADASGTAGANRFQVASSVGLVGSAPGPVADLVGASVSFDTRYAALLAADREAGGGTTAQSATAAYTITFTIDNPTGGAYRIDIDTSRVGALTLVNDGGGASNASASIGALLAFIDGAAAPGLGLAAVGPLSGAAGGNQGFSQSSTTLSLFDNALTRTITLAFTWSASASSSQDEAAVRLGLGGSLATTTADDYPGAGGRTAANDGHTVGVGVTLLSVPEPMALVLLALGLAGLARGPGRPDLRA
jgi:hypothetical protein